MKLHQHIAHHVRRHTENIVAHVQKHHTKYITGAGIISGMAIYKIIGVMAVFLGTAYMGGGSVGADYYDAEYYAQEDANKISISNEITTENIADTTGCITTGDNLSGVIGNCTGSDK